LTVVEIGDRLSSPRFLDLHLDEEIPDINTIRSDKEFIKASHTTDPVFLRADIGAIIVLPTQDPRSRQESRSNLKGERGDGAAAPSAGSPKKQIHFQEAQLMTAVVGKIRSP